MLQPHDRHLVQAELLCRHEPAVAGESTPLVSSTRIGMLKPNSTIEAGELRHLILAMGARVALVGAQPIQSPSLDSDVVHVVRLR